MLRRGRFDTVLGRVAFDEKGDLKGASWQWQQWTDGTYVPLGERQLGTRTFRSGAAADGANWPFRCTEGNDLRRAPDHNLSHLGPCPQHKTLALPLAWEGQLL